MTSQGWSPVLSDVGRWHRDFVLADESPLKSLLARIQSDGSMPAPLEEDITAPRHSSSTGAVAEGPHAVA